MFLSETIQKLEEEFELLLEQYTGDFEEEFDNEKEVKPSVTLEGNKLLTLRTLLLESFVIDPLTSTSEREEANDSASVKIHRN